MVTPDGRYLFFSRRTGDSWDEADAGDMFRVTRWPESTSVIEGNPSQLQKLARAVLEFVVRDRDPESEQVSNLIANTIAWMERHSDESRPDSFPVARDRRRVAEVAMNHGFNHLGRFSVEFRPRFGRLPRETLAIQSGRT